MWCSWLVCESLVAPVRNAVTGMIKLALPAGKANPAPPVGPALGAKVRRPPACLALLKQQQLAQCAAAAWMRTSREKQIGGSCGSLVSTAVSAQAGALGLGGRAGHTYDRVYCHRSSSYMLNSDSNSSSHQFWPVATVIVTSLLHHHRSGPTPSRPFVAAPLTSFVSPPLPSSTSFHCCRV